MQYLYSCIYWLKWLKQHTELSAVCEDVPYSQFVIVVPVCYAVPLFMYLLTWVTQTAHKVFCFVWRHTIFTILWLESLYAMQFLYSCVWRCTIFTILRLESLYVMQVLNWCIYCLEWLKHHTELFDVCEGVPFFTILWLESLYAMQFLFSCINWLK